MTNIKCPNKRHRENFAGTMQSRKLRSQEHEK